LVVLGAAGLWMYLRHGMRALAPYELPIATLIGSHAVALLWQRWRGV
jgi:hypothetical protein